MITQNQIKTEQMHVFPRLFTVTRNKQLCFLVYENEGMLCKYLHIEMFYNAHLTLPKHFTVLRHCKPFLHQGEKNPVPLYSTVLLL